MEPIALALALKSARKRLGLDQEQLAALLGVGRRTVTKLESGDGGVSRSNQRTAEYWLLHLAVDEAAAEMLAPGTHAVASGEPAETLPEPEAPKVREMRNRPLTSLSDGATVEPVAQNTDESTRASTRALKADEDTVQIAIKVPASFAQQLKDEAWKKRMTLSGYVRAILAESTDKSE